MDIRYQHWQGLFRLSVSVILYFLRGLYRLNGRINPTPIAAQKGRAAWLIYDPGKIKKMANHRFHLRFDYRFCATNRVIYLVAVKNIAAFVGSNQTSGIWKLTSFAFSSNINTTLRRRLGFEALQISVVL